MVRGAKTNDGRVPVGVTMIMQFRCHFDYQSKAFANNFGDETVRQIGSQHRYLVRYLLVLIESAATQWRHDVAVSASPWNRNRHDNPSPEGTTGDPT